MAEIRPFRALRYNTARVRLEDVLTQPYDKISPDMQAEYYRRSPYNLIRFELAKAEPGAEPQELYARSAAFLSELQRSDILKLDESPSLYVYLQRYGHPLDLARQIERLGLIALGRLHDYGEGVVFPHEQTLSGPKADRMNLLCATRTHSGQIFMLYEDPECHIEKQIAAATAKTAEASLVDESGVENLLWRIADVEVIANLAAGFADKKLIIADGHHRYETARGYQNAQRRCGTTALQPHDFTMMTLINLQSPGLIVLPTHRVVFGLENPDWHKIGTDLTKFFQVEAVSADPQEILRRLRHERSTAFVMATASGTWLLRGIMAEIAQALPSLSSGELRVDVTVLHRLVLERTLGLSEDDIREQRHVRYFRDPQPALAELSHGANAIFLVNPLPLSTLRDVCYAGKVMPQKATDFYPKLLSGLTLYHLDRSFENAYCTRIN